MRPQNAMVVGGFLPNHATLAREISRPLSVRVYQGMALLVESAQQTGGRGGGGRSHWPKASANRHVRWWISAERHCVRTQYFTHDLLTYIPTSDSVGRKPARQGTGQHAGGRPHHSQTKKAVVADRFLLSQRFPRSVRLEDPGSPRRRGALLMLEGYPMAG
jgi:hypothetical protein